MSLALLSSVDLKKCIWCGNVMERSLFSKCKANKDGLQSRCKKCDNEYSRNLKARNGKEFERKRAQKN